MILTCPQCEMRYLVSGVSIGPEGRKVRCASCAHVWYQSPEAPEPDGGSFQDILAKEMGVAPIPEGVKPIPEGSNVPAHPKDVSARAGHLAGAAMWTGYAAAACVFALLLGAMVLFKDSLVRAWPPSALFYDRIGMDVAVTGEGLAIDRLSAHIEQAEGSTILKVNGSVINLTEGELPVPRLLAVLKTKDGKAGDKWLIEIPAAHIKAEGAIEFSTQYPGLPESAEGVSLTFAESPT